MNKKLLLLLAAMIVGPCLANAATQNTYSLQCGGTEPFWSIQLSGSAVKYSTPDNAAVSFFDAQTTEAAGVTPGYAFQTLASREQGAKKISLSILSAGTTGCNDGMSDTVYKYTVLANVNGSVLSGCCK